MGPGAVGRALGAALAGRGWPVVGFLGRTARAAQEAAASVGGRGLGTVTHPERAAVPSPALLVTVREADIRPVAHALAAHGRWDGCRVLHVSGAATSTELEPLRQAGASVASWHPLMTFPSSPAHVAPAALPAGTPFVAEGDAGALELGRHLADVLEGELYEIEPAAKVAYHAAATLASNLVTALLGASAEVLGRVGIRDGERLVAPLARASVTAAAERGAAGALTGPVARGDLATLRAHVDALVGLRLDPLVRETHALVSLLALRLARTEGGSLAGEGGEALAEALRRAAADARVAAGAGQDGEGGGAPST